MATKEPTQKAKLSLKAIPLSLTRDIPNDYYLQPKLQKCLNLTDLAREVAALSTRQDDHSQTTHFFPTNRLYPNTKSQVGFVLPADAPDGSVWDVKLCTQLSSNGTSLLKEMRTGTLPEPFVVGEVSSGGDDEDEEDERPGGL